MGVKNKDPMEAIVELDECEYDAMMQIVDGAVKILEANRKKKVKKEKKDEGKSECKSSRQ